MMGLTNPEAPKPGLLSGIPFEQYLEWPCVHASLLTTLHARTPAHAKYREEHPSESTEALRFGRLLHMALLEPDRFAKQARALPADAPRRPTDAQRNARRPSESTVRAIAFWDEWERDGREVVKLDEMAAIQAMCNSVRTTQCRQFTTGGISEVSGVWRDPQTDLLMKMRLDYLQQHAFGSVITDIKTCRDASENAFRKQVFFLGYFIQAAVYVDGYFQLTGDLASFCFVAIEKEPPYIAKAYQLDESAIQAGRNAYRQALSIWKDCVRKNEYPAYGEDIDMLSLDRWQLEACGVGPHQIVPDPIAAEAEPLGAEGFAELYDLNEDHDVTE
jgi:exodeoxyribonuclease VIII